MEEGKANKGGRNEQFKSVLERKFHGNHQGEEEFSVLLGYGLERERVRLRRARNGEF